MPRRAEYWSCRRKSGAPWPLVVSGLGISYLSTGTADIITTTGILWVLLES